MRKLNDGDRFNIVRFSTDVETFNDSLVVASDETRSDALTFVQKIEARGGTAINDALSSSLSMEYDPDRPGIVAFLTDGKPTIGETATDIILSNISKRNTADARVFVFGVGKQVNTHLLDRISEENGGFPQYVTPDDDIEVTLSSFSDKMSYPVLSNPEIAVDKLKVRQVHPRRLPNLFCGDQLTVFGRYAADGHVAIHLTGEVNGKKREFVYEGTFPESNIENQFIPRLWATRRVGYLLDEIRLHGEESELKDEVLRLSKEYGIMTPYTSYLVLEDDNAYETHGIARSAPKKRKMITANEAPASWTEMRSHGAARSGQRRDGIDEEAIAALPVFDASVSSRLPAASKPGGKTARRSRIVRPEQRSLHDYFRRESGEDAVTLSMAIQRYKKAAFAGEAHGRVRHAGNKTFYFFGGRWVDGAYREDMTTTRMPFARDAYFKLLEENPELSKYLSLGKKVTVVLDNGTALVVE